MPRLLDLPGDVLYEIFKHLSPKDTCQAALVCKYVNHLATPNLYRTVELVGETYCDCAWCLRGEMPAIRQDGAPATEEDCPQFKARRKWSLLYESVSKAPALASHVRTLQFSGTWAEEGPLKLTSTDVDRLSYFIARLSGLRHLDLHSGWQMRLFKQKRALLQLQSVLLWDVKPSELSRFLEQPRLAKVFLIEGSLSPLTSESSSNVSEIFLRLSTATPTQLLALINIATKLKSLFWQRNATHSTHRIGGGQSENFPETGVCDEFPASCIIPTFRNLVGSLERLAITFCRVPNRCSLDRTIIGSLTDFSLLRYLHIEATLAIGIETCSTWVNESPAARGVDSRSWEDFVTLLPPSLEILCVDLETEQCDRREHYGLALIDALLQLKARLPKFRTVMLQETNAWYQACCMCDASTTCYRYKNAELTGSEKDRITMEQQRCALDGIAFLYLAERAVGEGGPTWANETYYVRTLLELEKPPRSEDWNWEDMVQRNWRTWHRSFVGGTTNRSLLPLEAACPAEELMYGSPPKPEGQVREDHSNRIYED